VTDSEAETLRQKRRCIELRLGTQWAAGARGRHQVRIDRGVDQAAGALDAGPVKQLIACVHSPSRRELVSGLQGKIRNGGEAGLSGVADVARERQQSAWQGRGDTAGGDGGRAGDLCLVLVDAESDLGAPFQRPGAAPKLAGNAEIEPVETAAGAKRVGRGDGELRRKQVARPRRRTWISFATAKCAPMCCIESTREPLTRRRTISAGFSI
jgi:hypothetical protein